MVLCRLRHVVPPLFSAESLTHQADGIDNQQVRSKSGVEELCRLVSFRVRNKAANAEALAGAEIAQPRTTRLSEDIAVTHLAKQVHGAGARVYGFSLISLKHLQVYETFDLASGGKNTFGPGQGPSEELQ
jgi:hypothetical protein